MIFLLFLYCGLTERFLSAAQLCLLNPSQILQYVMSFFYLPVLHIHEKKNYQCIFLMLTTASTSGAAVFPLAVFFSCSAGTSILLCPWWCICFTGNLFIFTSDYECLYLFLEHAHYPLNPSVPSPRSKLIGSTSVFFTVLFLPVWNPSFCRHLWWWEKERTNKVVHSIPAKLPVYPLFL